MAVKAIESKELCLAWYGQIIQDLKLVFSNHKEWSLGFTYKDGSSIAH